MITVLASYACNVMCLLAIPPHHYEGWHASSLVGGARRCTHRIATQQSEIVMQWCMATRRGEIRPLQNMPCME